MLWVRGVRDFELHIFSFSAMEFLPGTRIWYDAATGGVLSPSPSLGGVSLGLMLAFTGGDCTEIHIP